MFHLYFGRPLVSLPLSPYHSAHADINADGTIDHVHAVVNPGEAGLTEEGGPDCYGKATSMASGSSSRVRDELVVAVDSECIQGLCCTSLCVC